MKCSLGISNFLEEISILYHSIIFLYFWGGKKPLRKAFLSLLDILWNSAFKWVYFSFSPLLLRRKVMTNLDSIIKSRDITLPTKALVKAMVFPVVMYWCESWTIKKAEPWRIDAFKMWCWKRLLRVPWTARRSNQSILKEISPEYSLEGPMLKLKLQYCGHLMWRDLDAGKDWGQEEKGVTKD